MNGGTASMLLLLLLLLLTLSRPLSQHPAHCFLANTSGSLDSGNLGRPGKQCRVAASEFTVSGVSRLMFPLPPLCSLGHPDGLHSPVRCQHPAPSSSLERK